MSTLSRDIKKQLLEWEKTKYNVVQRDGYRCTRCGANNIQLYVHHIIPLSEGGTNDPKNLTTLCENCYEKQHGRSETSGKSLDRVLSLPLYRCPSCGNEFLTPLAMHYCPKCGRHVTDKNKILKPPDPKDVNKGCFIATAAYGTDFGEELDYFRNFRDTFLLRNMIGKGFVSCYYRIGPMFSKIIAESDRKRYFVRLILDKIYHMCVHQSVKIKPKL